MSRIFKDLKISIDQDLREKLELLSPGFADFRILRKSVDARRSRDPHYVYSVEVFSQGENMPERIAPLEPVQFGGEKPLIVGAGPAGLFAALRLVERGVKCILFERGSEANARMRGINRFWRYGELDLNNNVCFGEGGAGLYSDGKLITRIKSPYIPYVLERLVQFGAPEEILYLANPHVGSDRIRRVIPKMREFLLQKGCEIFFDTRVTELIVDNSHHVQGVRTEQGREFRSPHVIMAVGHSATDMLERLAQQGVFMEGKSFALGLRIEHPQAMINKIQHRQFADHPQLGAANYKLTHHDANTGIGVYSFCMCPGGYVLSSGTDIDGLVCNGMSNYNRNSPFANSAIVITVDHTQLFNEDLMGGMKFRAELERAARHQVVQAGGSKQIPAQRVVDFIKGRSGDTVATSCPSGVIAARIDQLLPPWMTAQLRESLEDFNTHMKGFIHDQAQFHAIESRTSCPLRLTRDATTLQSLSHPGLYPCGEGAGYAGGITSAACDGIRAAEAIISYQLQRYHDT
jgi:uncharacterized FAD-dependent dehydrogenase